MRQRLTRTLRLYEHHFGVIPNWLTELDLVDAVQLIRSANRIGFPLAKSDLLTQDDFEREQASQRLLRSR